MLTPFFSQNEIITTFKRSKKINRNRNHNHNPSEINKSILPP